MSKWIVTAASQIGTSHIDSNIPCQDSFTVEQNKNWLAIVVSDGAGTAKFADKGSQFVSKFFAKALISLSNEIDKKKPGSWVNDYLIQKIIEIRSKFREMASSENLNDYHSTLVACLIGDDGGFLIQIGDGAIFGGSARAENNQTVLSDEQFISLPENGEYANETFFITENSWIKHLRISPISKVDWICLGTDGGITLAMYGEREIKIGFVLPLIKKLASIGDSNRREKKLIDILSAEEASKLTSDDKTLCVAFKESILKLPQDYIYKEQEPIKSNKISKQEELKESLKKNTPDNKNQAKEKVYLIPKAILVSIIIGFSIFSIINHDAEEKVSLGIETLSDEPESKSEPIPTDTNKLDNKKKNIGKENKIINKEESVGNLSDEKDNKVQNEIIKKRKEKNIKKPPVNLKKINPPFEKNLPKKKDNKSRYI